MQRFDDLRLLGTLSETSTLFGLKTGYVMLVPVSDKIVPVQGRYNKSIHLLPEPSAFSGEFG